MALPILYSYRRCPYAMRARMALKVAGIAVEIREISLRNKPAHMLNISPKGTVPVLLLPEGTVLEESLDIMLWALKDDALQVNSHALFSALIEENDGSFKQALDCYKYPERYPQKPQLEYRQQGEVFLQKLEDLLSKNDCLTGVTPSLADIAIFPFIRQFAAVDSDWFAGDEMNRPPYPKLSAWLSGLVESELFISIMQKQAVYQAS